VALPHAPDAGRGDRYALLEQLGCGADLAVGGVVEGDVDNRRLDFFGDPVTRVRLAAADFT